MRCEESVTYFAKSSVMNKIKLKLNYEFIPKRSEAKRSYTFGKSELIARALLHTWEYLVIY